MNKQPSEIAKAVLKANGFDPTPEMICAFLAGWNHALDEALKNHPVNQSCQAETFRSKSLG